MWASLTKENVMAITKVHRFAEAEKYRAETLKSLLAGSTELHGATVPRPELPQ
jgi:hypothetical protein